jgi:hypothetical protein
MYGQKRRERSLYLSPPPCSIEIGHELFISSAWWHKLSLPHDFDDSEERRRGVREFGFNFGLIQRENYIQL